MQTWEKVFIVQEWWYCRQSLCLDMVLHILQNTLLLRFIGQLFFGGHSAPNPQPLLVLWNNDIVIRAKQYGSLTGVFILPYYTVSVFRARLFPRLVFGEIYGSWNPVFTNSTATFLSTLIYPSLSNLLVQLPCLVCIAQVGHRKSSNWLVNHPRTLKLCSDVHPFRPRSKLH